MYEHSELQLQNLQRCQWPRKPLRGNIGGTFLTYGDQIVVGDGELGMFSKFQKVRVRVS